ncbi:alcohol dehydrogenase catalytic domain-containing protein [Streptomyces sp. NPDC055103]
MRVLVEACGLNPVDYQIAATGHPDWTWPPVAGRDVVGIIDALGPEVTTTHNGQRVADHGDLRRQRGFAQYAVAAAAALAPAPARLDAVTAAAWCQYRTARCGFRLSWPNG